MELKVTRALPVDKGYQYCWLDGSEKYNCQFRIKLWVKIGALVVVGIELRAWVNILVMVIARWSGFPCGQSCFNRSLIGFASVKVFWHFNSRDV